MERAYSVSDLISYSFNLLYETARGNILLLSERVTWGLVELYNCSTDQTEKETFCFTLILKKWAMNLRNRLLSESLANQKKKKKKSS